MYKYSIEKSYHLHQIAFLQIFIKYLINKKIDHLERGMAEGSQEEGSSGVADLNDAP
jgi:hypothetical protein